MLNVHLSYKPPSHGKIMVWYWGGPGQFIFMEKISAMEDTGGF